MNIANESNVTLPKELQKAVESAKNTLTVTEQEVKRLTILVKDQETIIRGLLEKKAEADAEAEKVTARLETVKVELASVTEQFNEKYLALKTVEKSLGEALSIQKDLEEAKDKVRTILSELI